MEKPLSQPTLSLSLVVVDGGAGDEARENHCQHCGLVFSLIDFVYHSTRGMRVIREEDEDRS